MKIFLLILISICVFSSFTSATFASEPNNKFGIHIVNISKEEAGEASRLVNSNGGDWGYVTFIIQSNDRDKIKWQEFFNELRRSHLIPIVRISTKPAGDSWEAPRDVDAKEWADFLDSLVWPVNTRYVTIYNEPNHGTEWGRETDPASYAKVLDQTINELKNKSKDFFVLNAGLDASAPNQSPAYYDEEKFIRAMNKTVPGIFEKLDGWSSHSYPNPAFSGSPNDKGRGTIETYKWELALLKSLQVQKNLPVFITETGWQIGTLTPEKISEYYKEAFDKVWSDDRVMAVTPFVLNYTHPPFEAFSFLIPSGKEESAKILGAKFPQYYPAYETIFNIPKVKAKVDQRHSAKQLSGSISGTLRPSENYYAHYSFENIGLSIWGEENDLKVIIKADAADSEVKILKKEGDIEPGDQYEFLLRLNPKTPGSQSVEIYLEDSKGVIDGTRQLTNFEAIGRIEQIKRLSSSLLNEVIGNIKERFSR